MRRKSINRFRYLKFDQTGPFSGRFDVLPKIKLVAWTWTSSSINVRPFSLILSALINKRNKVCLDYFTGNKKICKLFITFFFFLTFWLNIFIFQFFCIKCEFYNAKFNKNRKNMNVDLRLRLMHAFQNYPLPPETVGRNILYISQTHVRSTESRYYVAFKFLSYIL